MTSADPPSPCTGVCVIEPAQQLCRGCYRTIEEITAWPAASAARKQAILGEVASRHSVSVRST
ncbi:MAG: DUF1289 domain-containing protein [Novosphingobium sp. 16-62-11]|nr:DUF1289 domain-containing protein [Novosphingobium sp. 17-62-19]OYX96619.1 MAG: DUF1289 domain-containing protein [Novosphingobium sp. 35-62-5]OYZ45438.1 MAG: DUF1289 domain-containing protein [Novosphingobium sp. 16-62-11]OZA59015.1 MAG: DUF1289 domain-containing protein [Sphingomonadales bacterium 39-62-4]HQS94988.1 DUF1289 domain-containing protein [Novosphingobium sp.]OZA18950.1 MAG: DUF1289 domain-containing protein [Novosphingobium sp. 17-62-19]